MMGRSEMLIAREKEKRELEELLDAADSCRGTLALVLGEPGIGKTFLAKELAGTAEGRDFVVEWGRCWEAGGAPAYWPWIQVLRGVLARASLDEITRETLAGIMPELKAAPHAELDPKQARFQLFDRVSTVLRDASQRAPLLVVLDDLHAADPSSLLLLQFLARDLRGSRLFVLGTCREHEARLSAERSEAFAHVMREAALVQLRRFGREEVGALLVAYGLPDADAEAVRKATDGNPLFVSEVARATEPGRREVVLPGSVRDAIARRIEQLDPEARGIVEQASVLGRELSPKIVARLAGATEADTVRALQRATAAGVVVEVGADRYEITHALLRDALYDALGPERRALIHARAAETVEEPEVVAAHLIAAVSAVGAERAFAGALSAAARAMRTLAFEDAALVLERAIEALASAVERITLARAFVALGEAKIRAGATAPGRETCVRAAAMARELGDPALLAEAGLAYGAEIRVAWVDPTLVALLQEALAALPKAPSSLRAQVMARLAAAEQPAPDPLQPIALAHEAIALARSLGDPETLRAVIHSAGAALIDYADPDERVAVDSEMIALAIAAGDRAHVLRGRMRLVVDHFDQGDFEAARAQLDALEREATALGRARDLWAALMFRAGDAAREGRFDEAEAIAAEAAAHGPNVMDAMTLGSAHLSAYCRAALQGRFDKVAERRRAVAEVMAMAPNSELWLSAMRAIESAGRGDVDAARSHLESIPVDSPLAKKEPAMLRLLIETTTLIGDARRAEIFLDRLMPWRDRFVCWGMMSFCVDGPYATHLGEAAALVGRRDQARALLEQAVTRSRATRSRPALARALFALGTLDGRAELVEEARALAEELAMPWLLARIGSKPSASGGVRALVPSFRLEREGEMWTLTTDAGVFHLKDSRGLRILGLLLDSPNTEIHVLTLGIGGDPGDLGDAGEAIDGEAVRAYRRRLEDLREEELEAERFGDSARAGRARDAIEALAHELSASVGLGGKVRRSASASERARVNVQKRVKDAVRRIEELDPTVGQYLGWTVQTGAFCAFRPRK
jgi:tetratricopeptide (TPR) repeat protein